jgi:hypothetical protein
MRTLQYKSEFKQKENALETMEIFVPLAYYIGAYRIKSELEDLSLKYLKPEEYKRTEEIHNKVQEESKHCLTEMLITISELLEKEEIPNYIKTRAKWHWFAGSVHDSLYFLITMSLIACIYSKQLSIASALIIYNYTWYVTSLAREFNYLLEYWKKFQLSSNRIFGIIDGNEFELVNFNFKQLNNGIFEIVLKTINNITDMSFMLKEMIKIIFHYHLYLIYQMEYLKCF